MTGARAALARGARPPSARGLLFIALALLLLYAGAHLLGLRQDVAVLTGTYGGAGSAIGGVVYVVLHLAATAVAPTLLIAAALVAAVGWLLRRRAAR